MARTFADVTEAELAVLQALWDCGAATIRPIDRSNVRAGGLRLLRDGPEALERLEAKGYVKRDRSSGVHVFTAMLGRDELIGRRLSAMAEQLCGGSLTPLLTHLVRARKLSPKDRQALRKLIEASDSPSPFESDGPKRGGDPR